MLILTLAMVSGLISFSMLRNIQYLLLILLIHFPLSQFWYGNVHSIIEHGSDVIQVVADMFALTVFVRRGSDGKAELVLLDHGLYDYLPSEKRLALCNLYAAIIERNESRMREHSKELGVDGEILRSSCDFYA